MSNSTFFIAAAICATAAALILFIATRRGEPGLLQRRLQQANGDPNDIDPELTGSFARRVLLPAGNAVGSVLMKVIPAQRAELAMDLARARVNITRETFVTLGVVASIGLAIVGVILTAFTNILPPLNYVIILAGGLVGLVLPDAMLRSKLRKYEAEIINDLPNVIDLLKVALHAGVTIDAAMARVAERDTPLSREFARTLEEIRLGRPRMDALEAMAHRTHARDMEDFVAAIVRAARSGAELSNVLDIQSKEMRRRRLQRAEESSQKAPIKMLFPMVGCMLPPTFVALLGPALIEVVFHGGK